MEFRSIGSLSVSLVGLGCNNFAKKLSPDQTKSVLAAALDEGINLFDTSDRYGEGSHPYSGQGKSEEFLGAILGSRRDEVIIATKFGNPMGSDPRDRGGGRRWVSLACEGSLRRLGTDYIDLYQIHRPDPTTPVDETLDVLGELVRQGKVREVGCSNFTAAQLLDAERASHSPGSSRFVSVQNEYSLLVREPEAEVLPACAAHDVAFLPYFPLASGLLTGKYQGPTAAEDTRLAFWRPREHFNLEPATLARVNALAEFATSRGHSLLDLAFSWLAARGEVASVIAGATTPDQVRANTAAVSWQLSADELEHIDKL